MPSIIDLTGYFIALCFAVFAIWWLVAAFSTKRTVRRAGWWRLFVIGMALVLFLIRRMSIPGSLSWSATPLWQRSLGLGLIADALALCGLVVMLWARTTLGGNWSSTVVLKEDHELITRGPYRFVRHPIYTGLLLLLLAFAVWNGHLIALIFWAVAVAMLWIKASAEERLLTEHFGDGYRQYKSRVKALVPYVF